MSTATTTVLGHLTQDQAAAKETATDKTATTQKAVVSDITREKWFWEIAVPS